MSLIRRNARVAAGGLGLALAVAGLQLVAPAAHAADDVTINLVGINDFHGRINANTVKWAGTVEKVKARGSAADTLFVGAGDLVGASEFASAVDQDQPTIDVLNELGLDASSVGNHEFDKGWSDLADRIIDGGHNASWDYLGANVYAKGTQNPVLPEAFIKDVDGVRVGVIGAVTQETSTLVSPGGIANLDFGPVVPAINRVADELTDGDPANGEADVLVATVHAGAIKGAGSTYDEQVAQNGEFRDMALGLSPKVDAVFQGHTHQVYAWSAPVSGGDLETRPLLQTGNYGSNVGNIRLTVDPGTKKVLSYSMENVPQVTTSDADLITAYPVLAQVKQTVDAALAKAAVVGNQPVGSVTADITTALPRPAEPVTLPPGTNRDDRTNESTLGDLVGNAMRDGVPSDMGDPDIGIVNSGGLRSELLYAGDTSSNPANTDGVVTYAEANNVLPFVNNVWLGRISGASLKKVLEEQWQPDGASRPRMPLGLSDNVRVVYDESQPRYSRVSAVYVDGHPLDPARTYTVSTFNFLATGGDNFTSFKEATWSDTGLVDRDLWIGYLRSHPALAPDFARQQVAATGLPASVTGGDPVSFGVSKLDLTSSGAPANTALDVYLVQGSRRVALGSVPVTAGAATVALTAPASLTGSWQVGAVARPSGTVVGAALPLATPRLRVVATPATPGRRARVTVRVATDEDLTPTGVVTVRDGGTVLGTGTLRDGAATLTLATSSLRPGAHRLVASYAGDAAVAAGTTPFTLRVVRAAAHLRVARPVGKVVQARTRARFGFSVTGFAGAPASGRVTLRLADGRAFTVTLVDGRARLRLPRLHVSGRHEATVRYAGDADTAPSVQQLAFRVAPRR